MDTSEAYKDLPLGIQATSSVLPLACGITAACELVAGARLADIAPLLWGALAIGFVYFVLLYSCSKPLKLWRNAIGRWKFLAVEARHKKSPLV